MYSFSVIGAAGYVAERHIRAIKETGNRLVSVFDIHDGLAFLDKYFPEATCFSDQDAYGRFHSEQRIDYLVVCSPNDKHYSHITWGIQHYANIICEKPLVLDPADLTSLGNLAAGADVNVYTILQLRLLDQVLTLRKDIIGGHRHHQVDVQYISARGNWYFNSWKGQEERSGGIVTNIGVHLFDLLIWIFGAVKSVELIEYHPSKARGVLHLEKATVNWFLSVDAADLPAGAGRSFRRMNVDGREIQLDSGMELLHTQCYKEILAGRGPGIEDARPSIELCHQIRTLARPPEGLDLV